ncbi:MAG: radical SAM/SPASM domain-containing protein [Kiloniellales bacterium]
MQQKIRRREAAPEVSTQAPLPVPEVPERLLLDLHGACNLRCPMCLLHGSDDRDAVKAKIGTMTVDQAREIMDEVMHASPLMQPSMWGEPLLARELRAHVSDMKKRGITVAMNTNGLTLTEALARFFVEVKLDSIFFSLDSTTPETLKKVRGVDKLDKIKRNLMMMLRVRGDATYPRIGVSFTVQEENQHELDEFVDYWTRIVDVVRVGAVYEDGRLTGIKVPDKRVPCHALYQTMPIHSNGDVSICCFDSFGTEVMGNVFAEGVEAVWHGERFGRVRHFHETGQWDKVPFCKNCNAWAGYQYQEEVRDGLLIRRSAQFIYYNRLDRLGNWHDRLRGHRPPDRARFSLAEPQAAE